MGLPVYLAMTAEEMARCEALPDHVAWLACHFSPYGTGLADLPETLPAGSLLVLDDRIPVWDHDPTLIARQLRQILEDTQGAGVLLDFQENTPQLEKIARAVLEDIPTAAVTAGILPHGPVLVPPIPPNQLPADYLKPWEGREVWLEVAPTKCRITVDGEGSRREAYAGPVPEQSFREERLFCSYQTEVFEDHAEFTLFRTRADIQAMLEALPVAHTVGLYQELKDLL